MIGLGGGCAPVGCESLGEKARLGGARAVDLEAVDCLALAAFESFAPSSFRVALEKVSVGP